MDPTVIGLFLAAIAAIVGVIQAYYSRKQVRLQKEQKERLPSVDDKQVTENHLFELTPQIDGFLKKQANLNILPESRWIEEYKTGSTKSEKEEIKSKEGCC